jgi:hypothetical protein
MSKQMMQKSNDLFAREAALIRPGPQSDLALSRCDQQGADRVYSLVVLDAGPNFGRLASRCPCPFDGTNQRMSAFIDKNKRRAQFKPLFLSWAKHNASSGRSLLHCAEMKLAEVSGSSTPFVAARAGPSWDDNGHRTTPRLRVRFDPASSSLRRNPAHTHRAVEPFPIASSAARSDGGDAPVTACSCVEFADVVHPAASVEHCVALLPGFPPHRSMGGPFSTTEGHAFDTRLAAVQFLLVSCPI